MIAYLDSSVLVRAYLPDEPGHRDAVRLLEDDEVALVTGTWSRIEVSGALVRAAAAHRGDATRLLGLLDADLSPSGRIGVLLAEQSHVEQVALDIVRRSALRAMDAWHLAVASITLPALAEPGERLGFATRDDRQAEVARQLGFDLL